MLNSKQRAMLKKYIAQEPAICYVGKEGLSDTCLASIQQALTAREVIKISVLQNCESTAREVADEIDKREAMIRATSEDGLPVVELGSTESPVKTKYKNDGMYIETNGATTSYFKNGKAYNYDMEAINSFTIGNFSWKPRANGNLSLLYTGGDN